MLPSRAERDEPAILSFAFTRTKRQAAKSPVRLLDFDFEKRGLHLSPQAAVEAILSARNQRQAEQVVRSVNSRKVSTATRRLLRQRIVIERSPADAVVLGELLHQAKEITIGSLSGPGIAVAPLIAVAFYPFGRLYFAAIKGMAKAVEHVFQIETEKALKKVLRRKTQRRRRLI
jgi:hypothetical protein